MASWFYGLYTNFADDKIELQPVIDAPVRQLQQPVIDAPVRQPQLPERIKMITDIFTIQYGSAITWSAEVLAEYNQRLAKVLRPSPTASRQSSTLLPLPTSGSAGDGV